MTHHDAYNDIQKSLLAYCKGLLERHAIQDFKVFDFDAHAVTQELPDNDLIGVADYSITNTKDQYEVTCMIVVCTKADDVNLQRLREVFGKLFGEVIPGATGDIFKIIDKNGVKRGYLTVMDDEVMATPVGNTKTRPIQGLSVAFGAGYLQLPG